MTPTGRSPDRPRPAKTDTATSHDVQSVHRDAKDRLLVWYDGACPLCRREITLMRRLDLWGAIDFVDIAADGTACPINRTALLARFHAREAGEMLSGAAAFAAMWRAIPRLRPIGLAARNPLVLAMLERLYGLFLRVRPSLQRLAARFDARAGAP